MFLYKTYRKVLWFDVYKICKGVELDRKYNKLIDIVFLIVKLSEVGYQDLPDFSVDYEESRSGLFMNLQTYSGID